MALPSHTRKGMKTFVSALMLMIVSSIAQAQFSCESMFADTPTRLKIAAHHKFAIAESAVENRVKNTPALFMLHRRVNEVLPAGTYKVLINGKPDLMKVSYDQVGEPTVRLISKSLFDSSLQTPISKSSGTLGHNMSSGLETGIQIIAGLAVLTTSRVRGNEETLYGLDRIDTSLDIDIHNGPVQGLFLNERVENWSAFRTKNTITIRRTLIEILR